MILLTFDPLVKKVLECGMNVLLPLLIYSGILGRRYHRFIDLEIRRTFTFFQLMTVLE
jgi:hypothetical protein